MKKTGEPFLQINANHIQISNVYCKVYMYQFFGAPSQYKDRLSQA